MIAVYCIENRINGMMYIGQTINTSRRFGYHRYMLRHNLHDNKKLQEAWNNYGEENFVFRILEETSQDELCEKEKQWIADMDSVKNGYNIATGGLGTPGIIPWDKGIKRSEELCRILSACAKQRIGAKNPFYNKTHSEETRHILRQRHSIPVINLDTGVVYESAKCADAAFGGRSSNVSKALNGKCKTAYGYRWAYKDQGYGKVI